MFKFRTKCSICDQNVWFQTTCLILLSRVLISTCIWVARICLDIFPINKQCNSHTIWFSDWPTSMKSRVTHINNYYSSNHLCGIFVQRLCTYTHQTLALLIPSNPLSPHLVMVCFGQTHHLKNYMCDLSAIKTYGRLCLIGCAWPM